MNQVVLVGRLVNELKEKEGVNIITIANQRTIKNENGEYETDFIDIVLSNDFSKNVADYIKKGDIIGIKGRIQTSIIESEDKKKKKTEVVADKITFLKGKDEQNA